MSTPSSKTVRKITRVALANKEAADRLLEVLEDLNANLNALLTKLDNDSGITDTDYSSTLATPSLDFDSDAD